MRVSTYKQAYDGIVCSTDIGLVEQVYGFTRIPCIDCGGSGMFSMTDSMMETCVACKGCGWNWVTL